LEDAKKSIHEKGYQGLGFVFTEEDPYVGVDLDDCRDPHSGEIAPWALEIIRELDSYTEVSPSGTGMHVLLRGELPKGRNRKGKIEMYDSGRYFTVTGEHLEGTPSKIEERSKRLITLHRRVFGQDADRPSGDTSALGNDLSDQELLVRAMRAKNAEAFGKLWTGDTSGYSSASEADLALCSHLGFWTGGDQDRVDRLFRQSGLYRPKWDERHYGNGSTYGQATIERALSTSQRLYASVPLRLNRTDTTGPTPTTPSTLPTGELPTAPEFPVDALPVSARRFIREAAAAIGCPPDLIGVPLLATLSAGVGSSRVVELKRGWRESATLFLAVVAPPGAKKTPAAKVATAPVWDRQVELRNRYREAREVYEAEYRRWESDRREAARASEPTPSPPEEPKMGRTVVEDTTTEALVGVLEANVRGVLVAKDELSGWVRSMDQYKAGGKGSDRQFWLSLWSNSPVVVDRKGKGEPMMVPRPWVSVTGSIQPSVLSELAVGREDGLRERFLVAYPAPRRIRLSDEEISAEATIQVKNLYEKLADLEMQEDENGEYYPGVVGQVPSFL
jgi:hypothetical protein